MALNMIYVQKSGYNIQDGTSSLLYRYSLHNAILAHIKKKSQPLQAGPFTTNKHSILSYIRWINCPTIFLPK